MVYAASPLPTPTHEEQERSRAVGELLRTHMAARRGGIPFNEYMRLALYAPGLGYYVAGRERLGQGGDFVTAPELAPVFGDTVGHQVAEVIARLGGGEVVEAGGGSGRLAADLLIRMEELGCLPDRYRILEVSPDLSIRQHATLAAEVPHLLPRIEWISDFPQTAWRGVLLANELLDSLPVHRLRITPEGVKEFYVVPTATGFDWQLGPLSDPELVEALPEGGSDLPAGLETEINLEAPAWVAQAGEHLEQGLLLLLDYGYTATEYDSADRWNGTLRCHYRHHTHSDPLWLPGIQDITAHVDFSALAAAGRTAGLEVLGYTSQAQFLLNLGLIQRLESELAGDVTAAEQLRLTNAVKQLTLPDAMGETFKALALGRGVSEPLTGFRWRDRASRL